MVDSIELEQWTERAGLLAVAADPIRLGLLNILARQQRCVCDLQEAVPVPLNLLSYHLRALREAGLVECSKRGRRRDYRLAAGAFERLHAALPEAGPLPLVPAGSSAIREADSPGAGVSGAWVQPQGR